MAAADLYPATVAQVRDAVLPAGLGLGLLLVGALHQWHLSRRLTRAAARREKETGEER